MSPSSPPSRKVPINHHTRHVLVDRFSTMRVCEPCRRRKVTCNGQRPCSYCMGAPAGCVYVVMSEHPRGVFTTNNARRLSSGSACETCRRRKTKCDGGQPCTFCATNGIECVNYSERRKRTMSDNSEAMDRIEDRLRRIEELMTVFTPSPLSQASPTAFEQRPPPMPPQHAVRQQRHSVQGISVAKEQAELQTIFRGTPSPVSADRIAPPRYSTPPHSSGYGETHYRHFSSISPSSSPPPPPLSPTYISSTQPLTSSMLNLTLSPSSSTSSTSNTSRLPQQSMSTPLSPPVPSRHTLESSHSPSPPPPMTTQSPSPPSSSRSTSLSGEWKTSSPLPSLMEQLSKRTFGMDCTPYSPYPIYPLSPASHRASSSSPLSDEQQP